MVDWYHSGDGEPNGPHAEEDIRSLLLVGQLSRDSLVWREGMPQWASIKSAPEFVDLFRATPPPLPPRSQKIAEALLPPAPEVEDEPWSVAPPPLGREPVFGGSPAVNPSLAGPWTRYFARAFDLSLISSALATAINLTLPYANPTLYLRWYMIDARVAFILLLPFAHVVNALIMTIFGNSIGKAIFGIGVVPLQVDRFGFMDHLKREFRVWVQGMALNIPIVNLFTFWSSYQQVLKSQPTGYDLGIANVKSFTHSGVRRACAMILTLGLLVGISYLNVAERTEQAQLQASTMWTNPVTRIAAAIPGGWQYELIAGPEGTPLYGFTNLNTAVVALLGQEDGGGITMTAYTQRLKSALEANTVFGPWTQADLNGNTMKATGIQQENKWPTTIYVTQVGNVFWRIVYIDMGNLAPREIAEPAMTTALFGTAGL